MNRSIIVLVSLAFLAPTFAGCLGDDQIDLSAPVAVIKVTPVEGTKDTFVFDASGSTGKGLLYAWFLGDGTRSNNVSLEHTYAYGDATYEVTLRIMDSDGVEDIKQTNVVVGTGENLAPEGLFDLTWRMYAVGEPVVVDASASNDPDDDPLVYHWDFNHYMDGYQYLDFRAAKEEAGPDGAGGTTVADAGGRNAGDPFAGPGGADLKALLGGGHGDTPGHGGGPGDISSTSTTAMRHAEQRNPEFTLDAGFPEAGIYFIRLLVEDVKGASVQVYSEEIIPVKVVDAKSERFVVGSETGNLTAGFPETVSNKTSDGPTYRDSAKHTFRLMRLPLRLFINLTWNGNDVGGNLENNIEMFVITPNLKERRATADVDDDDTDGITTESSVDFTMAQDPGDGVYEVTLKGTSGYSMNYTLEWWAELDFNDFRELEKDYVV